jgi:hypothetical protein
MTEDLLDRGVAACRRLGYAVRRPADGPPAVATPTDECRPLLPADPDRPVAVEPLRPGDVTPTMLLSRLRNDVGHGRLVLFVTASEAVDAGLAVLRAPAFVEREDAAGCRTFYEGPDRVPLAAGGYAAVRTDGSTVRWTEEVDDDPIGGRDDRARSRRLVLSTAEGTAAVLDGVDGLACPPAARFPYAYRRGDDRRFHVTDAGGREVGVYASVAAMRADAYRPVPMPLVPEHLFGDLRRVDASWAFLGTLDPGDRGVRVHTSGGTAVREP